MADIVINPAVGKIEFFSVKGDNVTNTLRLSGNTLLVTGPLSASSISTGGGGAFVTSIQPTANYLSKFTGNSTIANSLVYDDGTNVGIGTTSPAAKFIVNGGTVNTTTYTASETRIADGSIHLMKTVAGGIFESIRSMNADTTAGTTVRFLAAATSDPFNNANGGKVFIDAIRTSTNMDLAFSLNDVGGAAPVERVRFMGSGNVGIGTSNPTTKLAVSDGTTIAQVNPASGVAYFGTVNNYPMALSVNSSEKVRIFSGGSVSFGTSTDTLFSAGNIYLNGATGTAAGPAIGFGQSDSVTGGIGHRARMVGGGTSQDIYIQSQGTSNSIGLNANPSGAVIYFETQGVEKARITSAGNLGIGTTSPSGKLEVVGNFVINGASNSNIAQQVFTRTDVSWGIFNETDLRFYSSNSNTISPSTLRMTIASTGNVGIGTTNPTAKLQVIGNIRATSFTGSFSGSIVGSNTFVQGGNSFGTTAILGTNDNQSLTFETNASEKVRITTGGNFGIGTTSPSSKLHIVTTGTNDGIILDGSSNPTFVHRTSGTDRTYISTVTSAGTFFTDASQYDFIIRSQANNILFGRGSGTSTMAVVGSNVGIGTTVPLAQLHVNSTTAGATLLRTDGTSGTLFSVVDDLSDSLMSVNNSAGLPVLEVFADDRIVGGQYGKNDFVVINNKVGIGTNNPLAKLHVTGSSSTPAAVFIGNVGIGTTNPAYKLDVNGTEARIGTSGAYASLYLAGDGSTTGGFLYSDYYQTILSSVPALPLIFRTTNTERMRITSGGNVGIGTSFPAYKLDVSGSVRVAEGEIIATGNNAAFRIYRTSGINYFDWASGQNLYLGTVTSVGGAGRSNKMVILDSGNVGIGTTSVGSPLEVCGTSMDPSLTPSATSIFNVNSLGVELAIGRMVTTPFSIWLQGKHATVTGSLTYPIVLNPLGGNVGIGTTSPSLKLQVVGDIGTYKNGSDSIASQLYIANVGNTQAYNFQLNSAGTSLDLWGYDNANGWKNNVTFAKAGNVGIGTSSPLAKLHVTGSSTIPAALFFGNVGIGTTSPVSKLHIVDAEATITLQGNQLSGTRYNRLRFANQPGTINEEIYAGYYGIGGLYIADYSNVGLFFGVSSTPGTFTERVRIANDGNVGIGTTTVDAKLRVLGNVRATSFTGSFSGSVVGTNMFVQGGNSFGTTALLGTNDNQALVFETNGSEKVRITTGGNFGIGTTSPVARLNISGSNTSTLLKLQSPTANNVMFVSGSGCIGVGTSSPAELLDIAASADNSAIAGPKINFKKGSTNKAVIGIGGNYLGQASQTDDLIFRNDTGNILFGFSGAEKMRITSGGYVGIGTSTTTSGLQIQTEGTNTTSGSFLFVRSTNASFGGAAIGVGYQYAAAVGNNYIPFRIRAGSTNAIFTVNSSGVVYAGDTTGAVIYGNHDPYYSFNQDTNTGMDWAAADTIAFKTGGSERVRIDSTGNVGVGTSSPVYSIQSYGTTPAIATGGTTYMGSAGQIGASFILRSENTSIWTGTREMVSFDSIGNGADHRVGTLSIKLKATPSASTLTEYLQINPIYGYTILPVGNVGIGTTSPGSKLDVAGTINISSGSANLRRLAFDASGIYYNWIESGGSVGAGYMAFATGNSETMRIIPSGNVGIGTSNPAEKLEVVGRLKLNNSGYGWIYGNDTNHSIILRGNRDGTAIDQSNYHQVGGTLSSGLGHKFWVGGVLASQTLKMQIASDGVYIAGNLGVGTTSPGAKLVVSADQSVYNNDIGQLILNGATSGSRRLIIGYNTSADKGFIQATNTLYNYKDLLLNPNGGNVGIGTLIPTGSLHVYKAAGTSETAIVTIQEGSGGAAELIFRSGNASTNRRGALRFFSNQVSATTAQWVIGASLAQTSADNSFYFYNASSTALLTLTQTNIGIGTSSPAAKLAVEGGSIATVNAIGSDVKFSFDIRALVGGAIGFNNAAATNVYGAVTGSAYFGVAQSYPIVFTTAGIERLRIASGGSVGIGTTTVNQKLSIYPGTTGGISLQDSDGGTRSYFFIDNTNPTYSTGIRTNNYYLDFDSSGASQNAIRFYTGTSTIGTGTERMRILSGGNVGIGTSSPRSKLEVAGTAGTAIVSIVNTTNSRSGSFGIDGTGAYIRNSSNGDYFDLKNASGVARFRVLYDNNVYINTTFTSVGSLTASGSKLSVFGNTSIGSTYGSTAAPTNGLIVQGNVGIGTTNPAEKLQVSGSISADAFLGKSFGQTGTSGSTSIYDTYVSNGAGEVYELIAAGSPNAGGSSGYRDVLYGKIIIGTGFNGSSVTTYINYVQENPDPRSLYNSGLGTSLSASICFKSGSSEVTNKPAGQSTKIRVKIGSYISNAYAGYTTVRVKKLF